MTWPNRRAGRGTPSWRWRRGSTFRPCCWRSASRARSARGWSRCSSTWRSANRGFPHRDLVTLDDEDGVPWEPSAGVDDDGKGKSHGHQWRQRRTGWWRRVRRTQKRGLQSGNRRRLWRRHYPGADEVLGDGGSGQEQKQDARSHTWICRETGEPFIRLRRIDVLLLPCRDFSLRRTLELGHR